MARTPLGTALTQSHRRQQQALRASVVRDVMKLWPAWQPSKPDSYQAFERAMVLLVQSRSVQSAAISARYYELFRAVEAPASTAPTTVPLAAAIPEEQIRAALGATTRGAVYKSLAAGQKYEQVMSNAFVNVSGTVSRDVLAGGRETIFAEERRDPKTIGVARITGAAPCAFCAMLASRGDVYLSAESAGQIDGQMMEWHVHCVPGGTLVNGPSVELGYRRQYEGEVVVIGMADGHELSITPNHPVLTDRGWVPAGFLKVGDQVAQRSRSQGSELLVPDEQHAPAPIEDVWGALRVNGLAAMPVAAEDLHGDGLGSDGQVDIVAADGLFANEGDSALCQCGRQVVGSPAGATAPADALTGVGNAALVSLGVRLTAPRIVSGSRIGGALGGRDVAAAEGGRLLDASPIHAGLAQPSRHNGSRYAVAGGEDVLRNPGQVAGDAAVRSGRQHAGRPVGTGPRFDPPADHGGAEATRVHAQLGRDLLERLSGGVELCSVRHLRRVEYSGHVYNLRTVEGWYEANAIIISNCDCSVEVAYEGYQMNARSLAQREQWKQSDGTLNGFRQDLNKTPDKPA